MAGRELVVRKQQAAGDLREIAARATLREVRQKGHVYVELRPAGKRAIFFCTLCLTPCYSDAVLFDHLRGGLHARRYAAASLTLFGPRPWPFNDGVLFFGAPCKEDSMALVVSNGGGDEATSCLKENDKNGGEYLGIVPYEGGSSLANRNGDCSADSCDNGLQIVAIGCQNGSSVVTNGHDRLTVPGVLIKDDVLNLRVQFVGFGEIASKVRDLDAVHCKVSKMWCAWLGDGNAGDGDDEESVPLLPKCDFAIVSFSYAYDLGRKVGSDDVNTLLLTSCLSEIEDCCSPTKRRKKSFSDHEDSLESPTDRSVSNGDDSGCFSDSTANGAHELQNCRLFSSKALRRELRKRKRLAAERICDICAQPMLPGKDVATLLNLKTGNLACSSRNTNGAFHLFHVSCLIHWVLLCEFETWGRQPANKKTTRRRKGRANTKKHISKSISSIFCPECQGTGACVEEDELEKPSISLSEMFMFKLKAIEAQKAWMKNPEVLNKCSTGLHLLPDPVANHQEKVVPLKLLSFYRADA